MATMKKFRVVLEVTVNDDETREPDDWDWDEILKGQYTALDSDYGESASLETTKLLDEWEDDEDDEDDEPTCPYSIGDRICVTASVSEIEDHCGVGRIEAARIAGHKGRVTLTDAGDDYDVRIELDNGETTWINNEHLSMHVEIKEAENG